MMQVVWSHKSVTDMQDFLAMVKRDHPNRFDHWRGLFVDLTDQLALFPNLGKKSTVDPNFLEIVVKPFRVFYFYIPEQSKVIIKHVTHSNLHI